ncbi:MAG: DUF1553 domain-containing protein [Pirellulales bacterium]
MRLIRLTTAVPLIAAILTSYSLRIASAEDELRRAAVIIEEHCIRCHKPGNTKGDVDLSRPSTFVAGGLISSADVDAGRLDTSRLIDVLIAHGDDPPEMPKEGQKLSADQVETLRAWVRSGAVAPPELIISERSKADASWWAFQPIQELASLGQAREVESSSSDAPQPAGWIDEFIDHKLSTEGLHRNSRADRRVWLRRVMIDMLGLPPTPEQSDAFAADERPDAYERVIDRLLASPRYGEQWGRHWLDIVRFGESNGYERNVIIEGLWPYRDYVIRAWNDDKPFDQLIVEHLAGDVVGPGNPDVETGVSFLVCGPYDDVGNQDPVQAAGIRADQMDDMIRATGEAFLGLTIGCARCHDHKFDPILQSDYYAMYGTFAGVRHGARVAASAEAQGVRAAKLGPLEARQNELRGKVQAIETAIAGRADKRAAEIAASWTRPAVDRYGTTETFKAVQAKFVRLRVQSRQDNADHWGGFQLDEFEVWTAPEPNSSAESIASFRPRNAALSSSGGRARGGSRSAEDFKDAYGAALVIDGVFGERWIAGSPDLVIELAEPQWIDRVLFSSDRPQALPPNSPITQFLGDYTIESSLDGMTWTKLADSSDRQPPSESHRRARLTAAEITDTEKSELQDLRRQLGEVGREIAAIPPLPVVWLGNMDNPAGPFHVFLGGDPQRKGNEVQFVSMTAFGQAPFQYELPAGTPERERRAALGRWLGDKRNALPARVIANRLWHWHFGTGLVDTPSDFGYLGGKPSHPELLDALAGELLRSDWSIKRLQRTVLLSETYRQSSQWHEEAGRSDSQSRLLWRYPPRRMTAEEIRDAMLTVTQSMNLQAGGPGFRLYRYLQDNVSTYVPLDVHGPETWRRAVYHQNVRAQLVDVMSDFDCPDPASAAPRRAATTTPLQALTMLNHSFTIQLAEHWSKSLKQSSNATDQQITAAFRSAFNREPTAEERADSSAFIAQAGLESWCRALLNSSELIFVE